MRSTHRTRPALVWTVATLAGLVGSSAFAQSAIGTLREGDLIISEVMIRPNGDNAKNEWFEIYNASGKSIDLSGLVISGKGTETQTVSSSVVMAAGDYALFAVKATNNGGIGTPDYVYTRSVGRFDDGKDTLTISHGTTTFDSISWNTTGDFVSTLGYSLQLDPLRMNARVNSHGEYWCVGMTEYGTGGYGTPGAANESCGITTLTISEIVAGDLVITEVMVNPLMADDARGEYFEIHNDAGVDINLNGLVLQDKDTDSYTISTDTLSYANEVILLGPKDTASTNGGLPKLDVVYTRSVFRFDNSDEIYLWNGVEYIDQIRWTSTVVPSEGYSWSLDHDKWTASENNSTLNWCAALSTYGKGDYGTPQAANDDCP